jgi:nicotinamide phosphoribosyltransferase
MVFMTKNIRISAVFLIIVLCILNASILFAQGKETEENEVIIPVLMYHNLAENYSKGTEGANITPKRFEEHMQGILERGYTPIFVADYYEYVQGRKELAENPIIITFDDGYLSNYEIAFPILKRLNIPATIFVVTSTVGATYRDIVNRYYDETCDDNAVRSKALGSFDFRGDMCLDAALKAAAGWCMSFENTATVPAVPYLEKMFNCDCTKEPVAFGAVSTEHFVMCSNYAVDGDEITFLRRMLTELYPDTSFSAVLDSYDYWNVIDNILPQLHDEIMAHNGCMLMRGDSGDCVEVVTKTVFRLWEQFGGTVNSKGYKVLDPHVKAIYGDSITVQRCEEIYAILKENGFAASNAVLGVGSFSMHCIEEESKLMPFTRDTFGCAIKACYAEIDGKEYPIFKDPKEGGFKKSQKGLCYVYRDENGELAYKDEYVGSNIPDGNLLEPVFRDGKILKDYTLKEIRSRLNNGNF